MNVNSKISSNSTKKFKTRQLTAIGMLSAISIILGLTGWGFIPLPGIKATIMHVPVIIGAILEGPIVGMTIGLIFGIFSIFQNMMVPAILSFALINPLVSVLPRMIIGIVSYYSYKLIPGKNTSAIKIGIGAIIGSLTNTIGVLGMIYLLYAANYAKAIGIAENTAGKALLAIAGANGIPESLLSMFITIPIVIAIKKIKK